MREVTIKGVRQGILLVLPDELEWDALVSQLQAKLLAAAHLIKGARAQLDFGDRPVDRDQLERVLAVLREPHQMTPVALIGTQEATQSAADALGIALTAPPAAPAEPPTRSPDVPTTDPNTFTNNALYLRQTVRSGQQIRHDGTIVICGDVNPGAEIVATGDIIVFGTLRGVAHAGASGDEDCQIIAINLRPTQIRIAGYIARSPDTAAPPLSKFPEVARVQDSEIHIIPLREMS